MPEIGRISGPLLKENLTRDGVNLRFESNLIYLDVNTHAADVTAQPGLPTSWTGNVGIRNPNPAYPLDVVGVTRSNQLLIKPNAHYDAYAEIDNVNINGNTIQSTVGNLVLQAPTGTDRIQINSDTKISANLEVTGNITLGGTINIGDSADDDVVFAGEVKSNIVPDATSAYDLGSAAKAWRSGYFDEVIVDGLSVGNISVTGTFVNDQIEIVGNRIATFRSNADLELDTAGTGTIELLTNTNVTGDFTVSNDVTVNRDLTVKRNVSIEGNYLTTTQTSFYVFDGTATTVSAFGAAETLAFASSTGTTTFRSDVVINKDLQIKGGDLTTNATTFNLFNADASTINAFGAASTIDIGRPSSGRTNIKHDLKVDGSLEVVGDITLGGNIRIGDTTLDTINIVADFTSNLIPDVAGTYDIGTVSKTWRSGYFDDLFVDGISVQSITVVGSYVNDQIEIVGNQIKTFRSNADLELDTAGTGQVVVLGQGGVVMPVGNTAERPTPPRPGTLRFNTDDARFENYNGEEWNRMIHDDDAIAFAIALG